MENELKASGFQFNDPRIRNFRFHINDDFDKRVYDGMPTTYKVDMKTEHHGGNEARVELTLRIGREDNTTPFYIELTIYADFVWTDDIAVLSEDLLKENAVVLLISYARPFVAHMTADAGYRPFNLPFYNMHD